MAKQNKRTKSTGAIIKKNIKKIIASIIDFFSNLYKKFMSLKKYIRYIIYLWTFIIILLIILVAISASNSKFKAEYTKIEDSINNAALSYVESNEIYPLKTNKLELSIDMLRDFGYLKENNITDKTCVGYARVYYEEPENDEIVGNYVSKAYIKCKKYMTDEYKDSK